MRKEKTRKAKGLPPASNCGQGWLSTVLSRLFRNRLSKGSGLKGAQ